MTQRIQYDGRESFKAANGTPEIMRKVHLTPNNIDCAQFYSREGEEEEYKKKGVIKRSDTVIEAQNN